MQTEKHFRSSCFQTSMQFFLNRSLHFVGFLFYHCSHTCRVIRNRLTVFDPFWNLWTHLASVGLHPPPLRPISHLQTTIFTIHKHNQKAQKGTSILARVVGAVSRKKHAKKKERKNHRRSRQKDRADPRGAEQDYIPPERMLTAAGVEDYSAGAASRLGDVSICSNKTAGRKENRAPLPEEPSHLAAFWERVSIQQNSFPCHWWVVCYQSAAAAV